MGEKNIPVWLYELALVAVTIIWGLSFVVLKGALDVIDPAWLITVRFGLSALILAVVFHKRLAQNLDWSHVLAGFVVGVPEGLAFVAQNFGLAGTTPGRNAFLTATYCVMVPLMAWVVTKRRPHANNLVAALLCAVGVGFISLRGEAGAGASFFLSEGDLLTLVSAVFFAINIVAVDRVGAAHDSITMTVIMFVAGMLVGLPFALLSAPMPDFSTFGLDFWAQLGYVVVFATVAALVIQNVGQKHVPPAQASLLLSLESVFAVFFSVIIYGETLTPQLVLGFGLVFAAVVVSQISFDRKSRTKSV